MVKRAKGKGKDRDYWLKIKRLDISLYVDKRKGKTKGV